MADLSGRVALVTGAASGIGAASFHALATHGASAYGADIHDTESGNTPDWLHLDIREEAEWERAVTRVIEHEGRLDILVHAAGISAASRVDDTSLVEWRRVLETNLDGSFLAVKHGIRAMRPAGGAIVLIGSASGIRPSAGAAAYSASKAAVGMLARTAAKECRESQLPIRINVVSPGGVKTPIWRQMSFFQTLMAEHGSEEAAFKAMEREGDGGRFAEPSEIAESVVFLVSDAASHISGVELLVDGGYLA